MAAPYAAPGALAEPEPTRAAANGTEQAQLELQQASTLQVLSSLRMSDAGSKENGQIAAAALGASSNQPAVLIGLLLVQAQAAQPDPHFGRQQVRMQPPLAFH